MRQTLWRDAVEEVVKLSHERPSSDDWKGYYVRHEIGQFEFLGNRCSMRRRVAIASFTEPPKKVLTTSTSAFSPSLALSCLGV